MAGSKSPAPLFSIFSPPLTQATAFPTSPSLTLAVYPQNPPPIHDPFYCSLPPPCLPLSTSSHPPLLYHHNHNTTHIYLPPPSILYDYPSPSSSCVSPPFIVSTNNPSLVISLILTMKLCL